MYHHPGVAVKTLDTLQVARAQLVAAQVQHRLLRVVRSRRAQDNLDVGVAAHLQFDVGRQLVDGLGGQHHRRAELAGLSKQDFDQRTHFPAGQVSEFVNDDQCLPPFCRLLLRTGHERIGHHLHEERAEHSLGLIAQLGRLEGHQDHHRFGGFQEGGDPEFPAQRGQGQGTAEAVVTQELAHPAQRDVHHLVGALPPRVFQFLGQSLPVGAALAHVVPGPGQYLVPEGYVGEEALQMHHAGLVAIHRQEQVERVLQYLPHPHRTAPRGFFGHPDAAHRRGHGHRAPCG